MGKCPKKAAIAARVIVSIIAALLTCVYLAIIKTIMNLRYPGLLTPQAQKANYPLEATAIVSVIIAASFICMFIVIYVIAADIANIILKYNIDLATKSYMPEEYVMTIWDDEHRKNYTKYTQTYPKSYKIGIEFTQSELEHAVAYMRHNHRQYYAFPKSFLLPDGIEYFQPYVSLHTALAALKNCHSDEHITVLLLYRVKLPKDNCASYREDVILLQANLHLRHTNDPKDHAVIRSHIS